MTSNTVHVQKERHSSSWLGNSVRWFVVHEPLHTYITIIYYNQSFVGLWTHNGVWKCLVHVEVSVLLQVACAGPRSPELHRNKSLTVFSWDVVRCVGGGGCLGFQRGAVWFEFRALTAWGKKLLSSLAERALILRYRLPEGRSWKRLWEGWVGSSTILFALLEHRVRAPLPCTFCRQGVLQDRFGNHWPIQFICFETPKLTKIQPKFCPPAQATIYPHNKIQNHPGANPPNLATLDVAETNCWIKSLFLFSLRTKCIRVAS